MLGNDYKRPAVVAKEAATLDVLEKSQGEGVILSVGGGTSPGMPKRNIMAMYKALEEFNGRKR